MFRRYSVVVLLVWMFVAQGAPDVTAGRNPLDDLPQFSVRPKPPDKIWVESAGEFVYDKEKNSLSYTAIEQPLIRVKTDKGAELFAESVEVFLDKDKQYMDLKGDVSIFQGASVSRADWGRYYWDKRFLETNGLRTKVNGFLLESDKFEVKEDEYGRPYYEGIDAGVTLQDIDQPDSWLKGSRIRLYPEDSVEFEHMKVYVGEYPIFYFPYFSHSLNPKLGYLPSPGSRSTWGPYLKNIYGFVIGDKYVEEGIPTGDIIATFHLDIRGRRGFGYGFDMERPKAVREARDFKGLSLYYAEDEGSNILLEGIPRESISSERWRIALQERYQIEPKSSHDWWWRLDTNINVVSDPYMLEDFFPNLVLRDQQPDNTVAAVGVKDSTVFTVLTRFAPNDYYYTDERYPEVTWDRVRGPILDALVQYEGTASLSFMHQYVPDMDQLYSSYQLSRLSPNDPRRKMLETRATTDPFTRLHTYHEIERPETYGAFTFTPKIGGGYTGYYGVEGRDSDDHRGLFFAGMGVNTRVTGEFNEVKSRFWGLNGIKHVIEPYVNYSFVATNELDDSIPRLDNWSLTTNPYSLSVGRFSAIDSIQSWNTVRMGVRNFLITKRDTASHQWLTWDLFVDRYLNDPELDRKFSNMYSQINWRPKPWLSVWNQSQFPVIDSGSGYQEHNFGFSVMPTRDVEFTIYNRNLVNHPLLEDSNVLAGAVHIRISDEATLSAAYHWELNDSTLERQEYGYYRNLGSWVLGIGYYQYYNRIQYDRGIMISFTLKEFPSTRFPFKF